MSSSRQHVGDSLTLRPAAEVRPLSLASSAAQPPWQGHPAPPALGQPPILRSWSHRKWGQRKQRLLAGVLWLMGRWRLSGAVLARGWDTCGKGSAVLTCRQQMAGQVALDVRDRRGG